MPVTTSERRPSGPLISIVATAIASVGFGVSILTIWFYWILPSSRTTPQVVLHGQYVRSRRRSAPPNLQFPCKSENMPKSPIIFASSLSSESPNSASPRRVYFLEPQAPRSKTRRFTLPAQPTPEVPTKISCHRHTQSLEASPRSSSSTLVSVGTTTSQASPSVLDPCEESPMEESDTSLPRRPGSRLSRMVNIAKRRTTNKSTTMAVHGNESDYNIKKLPKLNANFPSAWLLSKNRCGTPDSANSSSSSKISLRLTSRVASSPLPSIPADITPSSVTTPSAGGLPVIFSRKTKVLVESPRPKRTQPYDYPYFATPPIPFAELALREEKRTESPGRSERGRRARVDSVSTLAIPRTLHKRRSASESWATGAMRVPVMVGI